jgi:hypothetical protein
MSFPSFIIIIIISISGVIMTRLDLCSENAQNLVQLISFEFLSTNVVNVSNKSKVSRMHLCCSILQVTKRPLTAGTNFKNSIIALVDKLAMKVSSRSFHL